MNQLETHLKGCGTPLSHYIQDNCDGKHLCDDCINWLEGYLECLELSLIALKEVQMCCDEEDFYDVSACHSCINLEANKQLFEREIKQIKEVLK